MIDELITQYRVVGVKQSTKIVESGTAKKAFIAKDADDKIKLPFIKLCIKHNVTIEEIDTLQELGEACNINVGAAVAVIF